MLHLTMLDVGCDGGQGLEEILPTPAPLPPTTTQTACSFGLDLVKCNLTKLTTTSLAVKRFTSLAVKRFSSLAVKRFTSLAV